MSAERKAQVAALVLLALAVWPFAHRALVAQIGLSPWRLFGFAMYAVPASEVRIALAEVRNGSRASIPPSHFPARLERALVYFRRQRLNFAQREPAVVERVVRETLPGVGALQITVATLGFDRRSATFRQELQDYLYPTPGATPSVRLRGSTP